MSDRSQFDKPYSPGEQVNALHRRFPDATWRIVRNKVLGEGLFQPTPLSASYRLLFEYECQGRHKYSLKVTLSGENVRGLDRAGFPHHYDIDKARNRVELCLYRGGCQFNNRKLLAETIVPWAIEWLFYYEGWLATGVWHGGGEHPRKRKR